MKKTVACIIARTVSKRLPLKVLRNITPDHSMLDFLIDRLKLVDQIDDIYICTSTENVDDILEDVAIKNDIKIYRGSSSNILERMISVGSSEKADYLIRITGDNPLTSYEYIDRQIDLITQYELDYIRLVDVPIGATAEVMTLDSLIKCSQLMNPEFSEYLMLYLFEPKNFTCGVLKPFINNYSASSITVDTPDDLLKVKGILNAAKVKAKELSLSEIVNYLGLIENGLPEKSKEDIHIKLPENKSMLLSDFIKDMDRRKEESVNFTMP